MRVVAGALSSSLPEDMGHTVRVACAPALLCSEQDCWFSLSPCECQVVLWAPGKKKNLLISMVQQVRPGRS